MAQMKDIPTSILATEGTKVKSGLLSILEKKMKMLKSSDYQLTPLFWQLVSYAGRAYLLGYPRQLGGAKATKKLLIKGCSIEMNLPEKVEKVEKVEVSAHSNETYLCIQCGQKIIFLKAESKNQRNEWVNAIRSAMQESISFDSCGVLGDRNQRLPQSVHNTADTVSYPGIDWRRVNTSPAGQFELTNRASLSSIPSSAQAMAHQKRRSEEMAFQSQYSAIHSLDSADIYDDGAKYFGLGGSGEDYAVPSKPLPSSTSTSTSQPSSRVQDPVTAQTSRYRHSEPGTSAFHWAESNSDFKEHAYALYEPVKRNDEKSYPIRDTYHGCEPLKSDDEEYDEEYLISPVTSFPDMPDVSFYMPLRDHDDQSSLSCVGDPGLESGGNNANVLVYEDIDAPKLPQRDYQTSVVQDMLVKENSSKKTRAPQPPETPKDQIVSVQQEKFLRDRQPIGRDKSNDDNEKEMRGKINSEAPNGESLHAYIERFRSELFRKDGFIVEVDKTDLSPKAVKLVCVADCICIAALPNAKLHSVLHVDDVIVSVNRQVLPSVDFCYKLFRTTIENKVQIHVKRVMHGILCHVILSANGDVDSLGLEFGNQNQGNEVTAMHSEGLVAKSGSLNRLQAHGVVHRGMLVNWGLVEINQSPVSLDSSPADVRNQIQRSGCELALVVIPMDLINAFKEGLSWESTDQTSVCAAGRQRNEWEDAIPSAPSTVLTTSTDLYGSLDVYRDRDQRLPRRIYNTAYTAPRPKTVWKRANTTPAGQFKMTNRASRSSIPASAQALAQQNQRSQEMASAKVLQSQQSDYHSSNSAERMRSSSLRELNKSAILDDSANYMGFEVIEDYKHFEVSPSNPLSLSTSTGTIQPNPLVQDSVSRKLYTPKSRYRHSGTDTKAFHQAESSCDVIEPSYEQIEKDPIAPLPSPPEIPVAMATRYDYDAQSSVSRMNNLGLESGGDANDFLYHIYDDTAAPEPPKRDYQNPTSVVQEGLVQRKSCKKTHAPKPPEDPKDPMDSIQRENPVCLETRFHQAKGRDKSDDDNEKEMRGKMNSEAQNGESLHATIERTTEAEKNDYVNLPEKAQSDAGTDSVEPIEHALDGRSATGKFGGLGGKLSTKSHGLTLHIPPGALEEDEKISLIVLTDIPEDLTLNEDELLVSHGFQCYPSGLRFKKPAKLIIPHCALVTAPNNIKTILYSWNQSGKPKRVSDPDNIICSVQERWLEVSISHFSGGFLTLIRDWLFLRGMLLSCMPFLPRLLPPSRKPILEVRFAKKPHGQKWNDIHAKDTRFQHVKGDDDEIVFREKTMEVACQLGEKSSKSDVLDYVIGLIPQHIPYSELREKAKVIAYFRLDLTKESERLVTLEVIQTSTQTIQFNTSFQASGIDDIPSDDQEVTDEYILDIAKRLPPNLWNDLYVALPIDHSSAEGIRDKYRDITDGYVHLLHKWRAASTRTRHDLEAILITAGAGGLVKKNVNIKVSREFFV